MDLTFETLTVEMREPGVMLVTMNRPDRLNAMNTAMMTDLRELFTGLYVDPSLANCMVLTGAGDRGFCPGADLPRERIVHDRCPNGLFDIGRIRRRRSR